MSFYAARIALYLGSIHRIAGFGKKPTEIHPRLQYYESARERMVSASRFTTGRTDIVGLLAAYASARLEISVRLLHKTPAHQLHAVYNFHGAIEGPGTITVDAEGNVVELNNDPVSGRSQEPHDNMAILAHWVYTQGLLSKEQPGCESRSISEDITETTLVPYFRNLIHSPPVADQVNRFWLFLDLICVEHWFYYLLVTDHVNLYRVTVALQRLHGILAPIYPSTEVLPSMNSK